MDSDFPAPWQAGMGAGSGRVYFRTMSALLTAILILLSGYLGLGALLYLFQSRLLYAPSPDLVATPADAGLPYRAISFASADGVRLSGWLVRAPAARGTVLFCHGNAGNISHLLDPIRVFHHLELNILVFDYRGYGQSGGEPGEQGTYLDAQAAWHYLVQEEEMAPSQLIICGRSLGGPIAAWLARQHPPAALILEATFTSIPDLGEDLYPLFPVRLLARYHYDTLGYLSGVNCPVLVVHSRQDGLIPFAHGQRLFEAAGLLGEFLEISGGHGDGFVESEAQYRAGLEHFLAARLP